MATGMRFRAGALGVLFCALALVFTYVVPAIADGRSQGFQTLRLTIKDVESGKGVIRVGMFSEDVAEYFPHGIQMPEKVSKYIALKPHAGTVTSEIDVSDLDPSKKYAIAAYHDVNENGVMDKHLAIPSEPAAVSSARRNILFKHKFEESYFYLNPVKITEVSISFSSAKSQRKRKKAKDKEDESQDRYF